ncbi:ArsR/SmtB family transcription factor [Solibacillus cecembensis]|uniref:ArsR/SmtB family transcription factor n=1 Tax=Solibacillus cecembensis TaxID=459347 RepID=UPI003D03FC05
MEALSNSHRLRIISILSNGKQYVSQLARELDMSRPLLYLHLQKLEEANIVSSDMKLPESGKAAKYYMLNSFELQLNEELISKLEPTLTLKKIRKWRIKSMSNGATGVNIGDIVSTIIILGFMVIPIILIVLFYKAYKKNGERAEERLSIEKQQTLNLQKQVDELNKRVGKIESLLKEVD